MAQIQRRFALSPAADAARPRAVSMMEVLTVISILVFLLALLVPGLGAAREHARPAANPAAKRRPAKARRRPPRSRRSRR